MTPKEFNDWYADFCAAYPGTQEWISKGGNPTATLKHWREILLPHSLEDAKEATRLMLTGSEDPVDHFDRASTPRHVAGICMRLAGYRIRKPEPNPMPVLPPRSQRDWDGKSYARQLGDCLAAGGDFAALSRRLMPIDDEDRNRYRCLHCLDRGIVTCWHPATMLLAKSGRLELGRENYSCAVVCSCKAGEPFSGLAQVYDFRSGRYARKDNPILFDPKRWLPSPTVPKQKDIDELIDFVCQLVPANYDQSLDDWNNGRDFV